MILNYLLLFLPEDLGAGRCTQTYRVVLLLFYYCKIIKATDYKLTIEWPQKHNIFLINSAVGSSGSRWVLVC